MSLSPRLRAIEAVALTAMPRRVAPSRLAFSMAFLECLDVAACRAVSEQQLVAGSYTIARASTDAAGNCPLCGEAGRCPGWHLLPLVRLGDVLDALDGAGLVITDDDALAVALAAQGLARDSTVAESLTLCTACGAAGCTGLQWCPTCQTTVHNEGTSLADHGRCTSCHQSWILSFD